MIAPVALIKSGARNGVKFQIGFQISDRDPEMCHVNENTLTILYLLIEGSRKFSHIFYIFRLRVRQMLPQLFFLKFEKITYSKALSSRALGLASSHRMPASQTIFSESTPRISLVRYSRTSVISRHKNSSASQSLPKCF